MGLLDLFRAKPPAPSFGDPTRIAEANEVLEELRPLFAADGGDMHLLGVHEDGRVELKAAGACHGCSVSRLTLTAIEPRFRERCDWFSCLDLS